MRPLLFILFLLPITLDAADATEVWLGWAYQMSGQPCSTKTDVEEMGGDFAACLMAAHRLEVRVGRWKNEQRANVLKEIGGMFIKWRVSERELRLVCASIEKRDALRKLLTQQPGSTTRSK